MNPEVQNFLSFFALYLPLGAIGIWRWSVWLFQKILGSRYRTIAPTMNNHPMTLSIVTPVYNESPELFRTALHSWLQNRPEEIIAVIDESDSKCIQIFEEFQRTFSGARLFITNIPGKRPALAAGSRMASGEIIALVDSDTVWDEYIRAHILAPFQDQNVGGVATRQAVIAPKTAAEKLFDIRLALRYLHEYPYLMAVGDALTCLSGRTAVYRRSALLPVLDEMLDETFFGKPCLSGEDKRLTSLIMRNGWKVRFQQNAVVRTEGMASLREFFKQNLRWSRNSWRTDLRLIFSKWTWSREPLFAYHLVDRCIQPFTLLLGPIYFAISLYFNNTVVAGILLVWLLVSRTIKLYPYLKGRPQDIITVPLFTVSQYYLAIVKIYAFLSLDFQSWITRWDTKRLRKGFFELLPSRVATFSILVGLIYPVFNGAQSAALNQNSKKELKVIPYTEDFSLLNIEQSEKDFWKKREENAYISLASRPGETPASILRKFNIPREKLAEIFPRRALFSYLYPNTPIRIPVTAVQNAISPTLPSAPIRPLVIAYWPNENMIRVKGRGNVVRLTDIARALPAGQQHLTQIAPKEWVLRSKLYISEGVTLIVDGDTVETLKLQSTPEGFAYVRSQHGSMLFNNTKVISWDEKKNGPDTNLDDGRAFIVAYASGRLDIVNSDISYLGMPLEIAKRYQDFGGNYGLSWKLQNGTFGKYAMTGNIIGSKIHHNYFGVYTYGTSGMIIKNNEVYQNIQYGIDPHDDSNNLLIEGNYVHNNGNHGIIGSKRVVYSTIRNNRSIDNRLHGIMLDRDTNYNLVEDNEATGNVNGMALSESSHNLIRFNNFRDNKFGIRASKASSQNIFATNMIEKNEKGVYVYGNSKRNIVKDNTITGNIQGVYLKESRSNAVFNSLKTGKNIVTIKVDESARLTNFIQPIK